MKHEFVPLPQDPTCCARLDCLFGAAAEVHDTGSVDTGKRCWHSQIVIPKDSRATVISEIRNRAAKARGNSPQLYFLSHALEDIDFLLSEVDRLT